MIKPDTNYDRDAFAKAVKEFKEIYFLDDEHNEWTIAKKYFVGKFNSREEFAQYWAESIAEFSFDPYAFLEDCLDYSKLARYLIEDSANTSSLGDDYTYINGFVFEDFITIY